MRRIPDFSHSVAYAKPNLGYGRLRIEVEDESADHELICLPRLLPAFHPSSESPSLRDRSWTRGILLLDRNCLHRKIPAGG